MRIDQLAIQKANVTQTQSAQPSAALETGDVLTATVQKTDGSAVVLKTSDGKLLNARLAENASLAQNDKVEFLVTQSGKDGLVLRIVYVEPQTADPALHPFSGAAENALSEALLQTGITPDARTLHAALALMRENGLSPKTALFFALNRMEATPERIAAYQALTAGQGPGETLYEVAQALSAAFGESLNQSAPQQADAVQWNGQSPAAQVNGADQTAAQLPEQAQAQAQKAVQPPVQTQTFAQASPQQAEGASQNVTQTQPVAPQPGSKAPAALQVPAQENSQSGSQQTLAPTQHAQQPGTLAARTSESAMPAYNGNAQDASSAAPHNDVLNARAQTVGVQEAKPQLLERQAELPQGVQLVDVAEQLPEKEPNVQAQQLTQENAKTTSDIPLVERESIKELPRQILDVFLELTGSVGSEDIKKFVSSSGGRLEALKFMAEKYDEESVRNMQPQLARAQEQAKLAQDVTRFLCYQLPVHNGEYGTAELYVYRKAKGKGKIDADNASVLISIPTESFGRVETLLRTENKTLTLNFSVEKESGVGALKEGVRELRKTLSSATPYHLGEMRVSQLVERTTVENAEAVLTGGVKRNGMSVDLKI